MSNMRILYHHRTQGQGVEGVHIKGMIDAFTEAGHAVRLVSPPGAGMSHERQTNKKPIGWKGFIRYLPEVVFELMEIIYNVVALRRLSKALYAERFDMIYERYAFLTFAGAMMAHKADIPFFVEVNFTCATPLYRKRSVWIKPIQKKIERYVFGKADGLIVVSTTLKKHLVNEGIDAARITVIPNSVNEAFLDKTVLGDLIRQKLALHSKMVIGFVGGFYPWHGVELLLDIFPQIAREIPNVALLLIGEGPRKEYLTAQARQMGINASVVFTGNIAHEVLPQYIAAFDLAVLPDSNDYGSPMKIYEYMAMGKPVVAPRLAPVEEGIIDGEVGLLFLKQDKDAFAFAILALLKDKERRLQMGEAARQHVLKNHRWKKNAEKIVALVPVKK